VAPNRNSSVSNPVEGDDAQGTGVEERKVTDDARIQRGDAGGVAESTRIDDVGAVDLQDLVGRASCAGNERQREDGATHGVAGGPAHTRKHCVHVMLQSVSRVVGTHQ
jgi:hypothetical protein